MLHGICAHSMIYLNRIWYDIYVHKNFTIVSKCPTKGRLVTLLRTKLSTWHHRDNENSLKFNSGIQWLKGVCRKYGCVYVIHSVS